MSPSGKVEAGIAHVRELKTRYLSGTADSIDAARELLDYLLRLTVAEPHSRLKFLDLQDSPPLSRGIGVPRQPIQLNNGKFLRVLVTIRVDQDPKKGPRTRVYRASYQYQDTQLGKHDWMFRYDYVREPKNHHPCSHLQLRGSLTQQVLPAGTALERIHFPTGRMTIEAVIRLLAEQFQVGCHSTPEVWRPILADSEQDFEKIAHRHLSGPAV